MPKRVIIALIIVGVFGAFMFSALFRSFSPHVGFDSAKSGDRVQVFGKIMPERISFDSSSLTLAFALKDDQGEILPVVYHGVVPSNFDRAQQATCGGRWEHGTFVADQLLLKCPSKYEGTIANDSLYQFYDEDKGT